MTHVDDLHEPGPDEVGVPPLDLDDLGKLYDLAMEPGALPSWGQVVYLRVPDLIAELREARQRIAEWEALEKREEWVVTPSRDSAPGDGMTISCGDKGDQAGWLARNNAAQMWRRMLSIHAYEPIDSDAPS